MKKILALLLSVAMLLSAAPFAAADNSNAVWTQDGNRIVADIQPDNTKSYVLSFDVTMPGVETATGTDKWPDEAMLFLREPVSDSYMMLRLKTYINGSGQYQVACAAQLWNGSGWNSELFVWSDNYASPVSDLHMELSHNAATHEMTWKLTSGETLLSTKKVDASYMTSAMKSCTALEVAMQRSNSAIVPTNTKLEYVDAQEEDTDLGTEVNLTPGTYYMADTTLNNKKSYVLNYDISLPSIASNQNNNSFSDSVQMFIRNETDDDYIYFRNQSYRDSSGSYQVSTDSQVWNGNNRTWSEQTFVWSASSAEPITKAHMRVSYDAEEKTFAWVLTDSKNATLNSGSIDAELLTSKITGCTACELKFQFSSGASAEKVYLKYIETEEKPEEDVTLVDTSAVWNLSDGFKVNEEDTALYLTKVNASDPSVLQEGIHVQEGFELSADWHIDGVIDSNNTYGGKLNLLLQAPDHNGYLFLRLSRYRNGGGVYQIWCSAQYMTDAGQWSNNVIAAWATKSDAEVLHDVNIKLSRSSETQALTVELTDKDNDESILKTNMAIGGFDSAEIGSEFAQNVLNCTSAQLQIRSESDNTHLWHISNPVIGACKVEVNQNLFTLSGVWEADTDENGYCYRMTKAGAGWLEYNAKLDVAAGIDFTYDIQAEEFKDNALASVLRLRCSENPEIYFFARIFMTQSGQYRIQGQVYNSSASPEWTDAITMNDWAEGLTGDTMRLRVYTEDGKLKLAVSNPGGEALCTCTAEGIPASFYTCETLQLMLGSESGNGKHILSNFRGLPEIYSPDKRSIPFTRAAFAFEGTEYNAEAWQNELCTDILNYQNTAIEKVSCAANEDSVLASGADLIVLPGWVYASTPEDNGTKLSDALSEIKAEAKSGTVIVVCGLPYTSADEMTLDSIAAFNTYIRTAASDTNVLYADLYNAMRSTPWSVEADGITPSSIGNSLISGAVLKELLRNCSCLAVNATAELKISASSPTQKTEAALTAFQTATDITALQAAVEDAHLGLDLDIYHSMTTAQQTDILTELLKEGTEFCDCYESADALFNAVCMEIADAEERSTESVKFSTYVAVGDSISVGETSVNKEKDGWVPHFAALISAAQGEEVTLINKAISGTRMCTRTDNDMFPPAVETVQSYIAPYNPDLLTIAYGINDYHAHTDLATFISTYRTYLTEVTETCPNAVIIVCGLCAKGGDADSQAMQTWNKAIKELAESFDLIYCETYYDMRGIEWLLTDGLHPTNAGYRVMANAVYRTLCGKVNLGETVAVCAHENTELRNASEPDCTTAGYTGDTYCTDCGKLIAEGTAIEALGHNFVDGICTRCEAEDPDYEAKDPCEGYTDIDRNSWYHTAADFVIKNGYMGSTKTNALTFEPTTKVSRAMVASILYRIAGSPSVEYEGIFTDVPNGKWFTNAIEWCAQKGLASGKGNGKFDPNGNVTRQELAVFMCKLAAYQKKDVSGSADLSKFSDEAKVPSWAKTYVQWAVSAGLISGKGTGDSVKLAPLDNATRAEFASIIMRYIALG